MMDGLNYCISLFYLLLTLPGRLCFCHDLFSGWFFCQLDDSKSYARI